MDLARERLIFRIYEEALALPPAERTAFLEEQCHGDADLLAQVAACLAAATRDATTQEQGLAEVIGDGVAAAVAAIAPTLPNVGDDLGKYHLLEQIGRGGMGVVFKAEDRMLRRLVALKMLHRRGGDDAGLHQRFEREGRALAALRHPHIVQVYGLEAIDDHLVLVMEYLEGHSLTIPATGMTLPAFLATACPLADAVAAAHEAGIVHRDLKPGNILITADGLKVLDFGLAQHQPPHPQLDTTQRLTASGMVMGTVPYMSPEQARGLPLDARSDLFSLGVIFYEALTGRRPFAGKTASDVISAILRDDPPPLPPTCDDLPDALIDILRRCLDKNPDKRFASARHLHTALQALQPNPSPTQQPLLLKVLLHLAPILTGAGLTFLALNLWRLDRQPPPKPAQPPTQTQQVQTDQVKQPAVLEPKLPAISQTATPQAIASFHNLILAGNFEHALSLLTAADAAQEVGFSQTEQQIWAARLYLLMGQPERARDQLSAAAHSPQQRNQRALAMMELGFPGRAWELLGTSARDAQHDNATALLRAVSALHQKQWSSAHAALEQARGQTAAEEWTWWWIRYLEGTDAAAAADELKRFIASEQVKHTRPDRWVISHLRLAEAYRRLHRRDQALLWYDRFLDQWAAFPNGETRFAQERRAALQHASR